jgi:hypothetical protein
MLELPVDEVTRYEKLQSLVAHSCQSHTCSSGTEHVHKAYREVHICTERLLAHTGPSNASMLTPTAGHSDHDLDGILQTFEL